MLGDMGAAAGGDSPAQEELLEPLASPSKPLASEEMSIEDYADVEAEILVLAAKKCWGNYHAWKSLLNKGEGSDKTNKRHMDAWRHKALLIESRIQELQQRA